MTRTTTSGLVCLTAAVVVLGGFWWKARQAAAQDRAAWEVARAEWARQQRELESALAEARNRPASGQAPAPKTVLVPQGPSATELLQKVALVRPGNGPERSRSLREVVYYLEALERIGEPAVPPIQAFLERFEDVAYDPDTVPADETEEGRDTQEISRGGPPSPQAGGGPGRGRQQQMLQWEQLGRMMGGRSGRRPLPRMNYDFPPTLRLGLIDTLRDIRGEAAETAIAGVIQQSGRAIEIAYAAKTLKEMSGDRWRAVALSAAHELLLNPATAGSTARVDRRSEEYLYAVLDLFDDSGFAETAAQRLITGEGKLDRAAFGYLSRTLQQNALPTFQAAFNDPRLTNVVDRASLLQQAMPYLGVDVHANSMFTTVVTDPNLPAQVRSAVLQSLARTGEEGEGPDLAVLQQRYDLLQSLKSQLDTEAYRRVNASLSQRLGIEVPADEVPKTRRRDAGVGGQGSGRGFPGGRNADSGSSRVRP